MQFHTQKCVFSPFPSFCSFNLYRHK
ncbi:protein of unknown function [Thauera humireducens]|nr:protein of unknown function [Thauera humireducens]